MRVSLNRLLTLGKISLRDVKNRTYEEYKAEVESGHLAWGNIHEDLDFWKENGAKLGEEEKSKVLK